MILWTILQKFDSDVNWEGVKGFFPKMRMFRGNIDGSATTVMLYDKEDDVTLKDFLATGKVYAPNSFDELFDPKFAGKVLGKSLAELAEDETQFIEMLNPVKTVE